MRVEPVKIPDEGVLVEEPFMFVVANTCVIADKHTSAPMQYNLRVIETRLAAVVLGKQLGVKLGNGEITTLKDVLDEWRRMEIESGAMNTPCAGNPIDHIGGMLECAEKAFKHTPYSYEEVAEVLEMSVDEMKKSYMGDMVIKADNFELYKRAKHVFSEAQRVFMFASCAKGQAPYTGHLLHVN